MTTEPAADADAQDAADEDVALRMPASIILQADETGEELARWPGTCAIPRFADFIALKKPPGLYQVDRVLWVVEGQEQVCVLRIAKVDRRLFFKEIRT